MKCVQIRVKIDGSNIKLDGISWTLKIRNHCVQLMKKPVSVCILARLRDK